MNKQDFIDRLRMALNGRVSPGLVMDNVNYYEDYINTEIRKGRTEEEVLESLGDPRLIARTIIQTNGGDNRSGYRNTVYGNGEYREAAGSTVHHSYNGDGNGEYGTHRSKMADVLAKLPVWVWIIPLLSKFVLENYFFNFKILKREDGLSPKAIFQLLPLFDVFVIL